MSGSAWKGWLSVNAREAGDQLELEVGRPLVRVLDLPRAGRPTCLCWRKRRFRCRACGRSFTASRPELPPRQRVTHRFRRHHFARAGCGAHAEITREERTTRYRVERAFRLGA